MIGTKEKSKAKKRRENPKGESVAILNMEVRGGITGKEIVEEGEGVSYAVN